MKGYYKQEDATSTAIIDDWLHTGDVGKVDEGGYLFITGRKKDLIIRGGENISPGEIENVPRSPPRVEEAAVIGVPDAEWGEVVKAVIVPQRRPASSPPRRSTPTRRPTWPRSRPRSTTPSSTNSRATPWAKSSRPTSARSTAPPTNDNL